MCPPKWPEVRAEVNDLEKRLEGFYLASNAFGVVPLFLPSSLSTLGEGAPMLDLSRRPGLLTYDVLKLIYGILIEGISSSDDSLTFLFSSLLV